MKLESLPNELIFEIFEYLKVTHILNAFYGLNARFNEILDISFKRYYLDFQSVSKTTFTTICRDHLPLILDKIISLYLADDHETPNLPVHFLSYNIDFDQFIHLKSLSLQAIQSDDLLNKILLKCRNLSYFTHLQLIGCPINNQNNELINNIWSLPKLIDFRTDYAISKGKCFSKLLVSSSSIKYLSIQNVPCDVESLYCILAKTPSLERLNITMVSTEKNEKLSIAAPHLTTLNLSFRGPVQTMKNLFQQFFNLRRLTLSIFSTLIDGNEWQNILSQCLPKIEAFRLKMEFNLPQTSSIENSINRLLDTFQTNFWIRKHRWFVRCDWNPSNTLDQVLLYTLPYAYEDFNFLNEFHSKSTSSKQVDYKCYSRVRTLQYSSNPSHYFANYSIQFRNISQLILFLPFNQKFLYNIPSLYHLIFLDVSLLPGDTVYAQLQLLLDLAPHLHTLRFSHLSDLDGRLFKIENSSIRRLEFFTKESSLYAWYFTKQQCIELANSPLGRQCQTLVIDIKERTSINDLIENMINLQSLIFECKQDKSANKKVSQTNDEFLEWLKSNLPPTCLISRHSSENTIIQVWIR